MSAPATPTPDILRGVSPATRWCPHCNELVETYTISAEEMGALGANIMVRTDSDDLAVPSFASGTTRYLLRDEWTAIDTPLCYGCDTELPDAPAAVAMRVAA